MNEIKLYRAKWIAIKMMLLGSIFVFGIVWLMSRNAIDPWMTWIGLLFSGSTYPLGLFHLFDKRPLIIINEMGIFDRTTHNDFIKWEIIKDVYFIDSAGQTYISLVVDEAFLPSKKKSKFYQKAVKINGFFGAQELNLCLPLVKIDNKKLLSFVKSMSVASELERRELLTNAVNEFRK